MAPKAEKKKAPPPPPTDWVPRGPASTDFFECIGSVVTHLRSGTTDTVRGKNVLFDGLHRITYEITHAAKPNAQGLVVGVCDGTAWSGDSDPAAGEAVREALGLISGGPAAKGTAFYAHGHTMAWGLCLCSGRLLTSRDVARGKFGGATLGKVIMPDEDGTATMYSHRLPDKTIVVCEVDLLDTGGGDYSGDLLRRTFACSLHPLELRGKPRAADAPTAMPRERRTLRFSVNRGEFVDSGIVLPSAVMFPWVQSSMQGDMVTLVGVEKWARDAQKGA